MTGFSNVEEEQVGLAENAPWLLEDRLKQLGADYSTAAEPWGAHVVVDRNLYTGQNPQSSAELAERLVADLGGTG
jgi:putative intracellular protease/amidase